MKRFLVAFAVLGVAFVSARPAAADVSIVNGFDGATKSWGLTFVVKVAEVNIGPVDLRLETAAKIIDDHRVLATVGPGLAVDDIPLPFIRDWRGRVGVTGGWIVSRTGEGDAQGVAFDELTWLIYYSFTNAGGDAQVTFTHFDNQLGSGFGARVELLNW